MTRLKFKPRLARTTVVRADTLEFVWSEASGGLETLDLQTGISKFLAPGTRVPRAGPLECPEKARASGVFFSFFFSGGIVLALEIQSAGDMCLKTRGSKATRAT